MMRNRVFPSRLKPAALLVGFCLAGIVPALAEELAIGSKSAAKISVPEAFQHENEDEKTIFLMPRRNQPDGPISMFLTCLADLSDKGLSENQVQELLDRLNPKSPLLHFGSNLATTQTADGKSDDGKAWHFVHYAVYADQLLVTVTVQTMKGREKEPECQALLDEVPRMLASLKRK